MSHPWAWPAWWIAAAVAAGELSAADVVQSHLARITAVDPGIRAFADVDSDRALAAARTQADQAALGVASVPAFRHGERSWIVAGHRVGYLDAMMYTQWFNVLGAPVAVVPAGRSGDSLPIGVQVVGRPFEEARVLGVAARIEQACGGFAAPPVAA